MRRWMLLIVPLLLLSSCVREENHANSPIGNFEALTDAIIKMKEDCDLSEISKREFQYSELNFSKAKVIDFLLEQFEEGK